MSDSFQEKKQWCREISDSYPREVERTKAVPVARRWRSLVIRISVLPNADVSNSCNSNIVSSCSVSLSADWDPASAVVSYGNVIQPKSILRIFNFFYLSFLAFSVLCVKFKLHRDQDPTIWVFLNSSSSSNCPKFLSDFGLIKHSWFYTWRSWIRASW
jgi:hypothetical protein